MKTKKNLWVLCTVAMNGSSATIGESDASKVGIRIAPHQPCTMFASLSPFGCSQCLKGDMVDGAVFVFPPKRQTLTNTLQFDQVSESQTVALATVYNACSSMYHSYHPTWGDEKKVLNKLCWTCHGRFFNIKVVTEEYCQSTNQNAITYARSVSHFENQLSRPPPHFLYLTIPKSLNKRNFSHIFKQLGLRASLIYIKVLS